MYVLYGIFLFFFRIIVGALALFDSKIKKGIEGRKNLFPTIEKYYPTLNPLRKRVLIHVASFGELEQAKPVIAELKRKFPEIHIHLTFFSPSGYENAIGSYRLPDIITYLPFDTNSQVNWFLDITKPDLILFVRYDLWHNFVHEAHDRNIPMLLFSASFSPSAGKLLPGINSLYRKTYSFMNAICTIGESDKSAIEKFAVHSHELIVAGDTRFDQVVTRKQSAESGNENPIPDSVQQKIESEGMKVLVAGSTWEQDENIIFPVIKKVLASGEKLFVILVPHEPFDARVANLLKEFGREAILLSKIDKYQNEKIVIVDSIGKLFTLYRNASFAYVGGGFGAGVHNVVEPAVWGAPSIIGPNHQRSKEIDSLIGFGGVVEIRTTHEFEEAFGNWFVNDKARNTAGLSAMNFVHNSQGATQKIMEMITSLRWYS